MALVALPPREYHIWEDHNEQWPEDSIPEPDDKITATTINEAAEVFCRRHDRDVVELIILNTATNELREVHMQRVYQATYGAPTTLEKLRSP